jgi:uncharacterized repeat protein (TIGR02543 family)
MLVMKRIFFSFLLFALAVSFSAFGADIYVAPDGSDANAGTLNSPYRSLQKAILQAAAGDYIYLRGGTYSESTGITVARGNNGTADALKHIVAYASEVPVLNFSAQTELSNNRGLTLNGNYWQVKGIIVEEAGDNGIFIGGSNNTVEKCITRRNRDSGLQLGRYSSTATVEEWPSNNLILDCESYDNRDATNENADGFACKLTTGTGNIFRGCIAHHNIDDGWDLFTKTDTGPIGAVTLENCIAHSNGTLTTGGTSGNGDKNGFKLGGEGIPVNHIVRRCIAFNNGKHGFTYNSNPGSIEITNCTGYKNAQRNFSFDAGTHVFTNNLSYLPASNDKVIGNTTAPNAFSNDVNWGFTVSAATFQTLTPGSNDNPTANGFLNLASGSPLIDAGVVTAGIAYSGSTPDLGAIEFGGTVTPPPASTYTLALSASTSVGGTVSKNPDKSSYTNGEVVTVTATPASGYTFSGWTGDATGTTNPLSVTMSSNKTITANFTVVSSGGGGSSSTLRIDNTATTTTGLCSFDGSFRLVGSTNVINLSNTAGKGVNWKVEVPTAGTYQVKWRYAGGGSTAQETVKLLVNGTVVNAAVAFPRPASSTSFLVTTPVDVQLGNGVNEIRIEVIQSVAMGDIEWIEVTGNNPKAANCSAAIGSGGGGNPTPVTYSVTSVSNPSAGGLVSLSPAGGTYENGTVVTATATPASGYQFSGWTGDATGNSTSTSITVDANKNITANFTLIETAPVTYQLTTTVSGQGTVSPASGTYNQGATATLTATPAQGWQFAGWSGAASGTTNPLIITMDGNKTVTATFSNGVPPVVDNGMIGYATISGEGYTTTTGGVVAGQPCKKTTISSLSQLEAWALSREKNTTPEVVYISGKISAPSTTVVTIKNGANVSVLGIGSTAELQNVGLNFRDYNNVIVRNLKIHEVFYPNDALTIDNCQHVWVDHCELHSIIGPGITVDTYDGLLDIKNGSRYVTISWCHLHDHMKTSLIGHTDNADAEATDRQIRVTLHHNFYENTDGRNPSLRWGAVHMFNNYLKNITDYGIAVRQGAHALIENNVYENVKLPISTNKFDGEGYACERGNLFTGTSGANSITQTGCDFWNSATLPYTYTLDPVASVATNVPANVGVGKIDVSTTCGATPPPATTYQLTTSVNGQGTVSPANGTFNNGEIVTVMATAATGYTFSGWTGDATGSANPLSVTMSSNKNIIANFTISGETPPSSTGSVTILATATTATGLCSFDGSLRAVSTTSVINLSNTAGRGVNWKVEVPTAGTYQVKWRYAGGGSTAQETSKLLVNGTGVNAAVPFPKPASSTSFLTTDPVTVSLGKGVNEIRIEVVQSAAMGDIEWIEVTGNNPKVSNCSAAIGSGGDNTTQQQDQTITFASLPQKRSGDADFEAGATASSPLPVSYSSSDLTVAIITSDGKIHIVGAGTTVITASQSGNTLYKAAPPVAQQLSVFIPPVVKANNLTVAVDANGNAVITPEMVNDGSVSYNGALTLSLDKTTFNCSNIGTPVTVTLTGTDEKGYAVSSAAEITITDELNPDLTVPANQFFCFAGDTYHIPSLSASDNCGILTVTYSINGATTRSGTGKDASGLFNEGQSIITWTVTDIHGNFNTATTTVTVNPPLSSSIPDVYAMNPAVDNKNTIYIGYGPSSLTIKVLPVGGSAPYSYKWSTDETTESIVVSTAGTYSATVTDAKGCQISASIDIKMQNVECGNANDKVMICHNSKAICIASSAVQEHLNHGDRLGSCSATTATNLSVDRTTNIAEELATKVLLYPNPVTDKLTIGLTTLNKGATLQLFNSLGAIIISKNLTNSTTTISLKALPSGVYYVKVRNGQRSITDKIVKQ